MANYLSHYGSGETDTNVFDEDLLSTMLFYSPDGPTLSKDSKAVAYYLGGTTGIVFTSDAGFDGLWNGTVNTIGTADDKGVLSIADNLSIDGHALRDAIAEGNTDLINKLAWSGNDTIIGGDSRDTLKGYDGRDLLLGGAGNDTLIGDAGNDRAVGGTGDDNVFGGNGNDRLFGSAGDDVIVGGAGNDVLGGGAGSDTLSGGTGADTFDFRSIGQFKGASADFITDFSHADGDRIDLSMIDADTGTAGNQAFTFIDGTGGGIQPSTPLAAGSLIVELTKDADLYSVSLVINDKGADATFFVHSATVLTADDFLL